MTLRRLIGRIRRRVQAARPAPVILMYHRVVAARLDPWGLAVHPANFEAHLEILRKHRSPMTMSAFVRELDGGTLPPDAVALTFDDGYGDNLQHAKPRLESAGVPATIFLMAGAINSGIEFWWDELARRILGPHVIDGRTRLWRAWHEPRTEHERTYLELWNRLRDLPASDREREMSRLRDRSDSASVSPGDLPLSESDVSELARASLVEIGGHTVTHPVLPQLDREERRREILESKRLCERLTGRPIAGFAYPHGAMDADTRAAVQESGFDWACSTRSSHVPARGFDRYALPRVFVPDCDGGAFERLLDAVTRVEAAS